MDFEVLLRCVIIVYFFLIGENVWIIAGSFRYICDHTSRELENNRQFYSPNFSWMLELCFSHFNVCLSVVYNCRFNIFLDIHVILSFTSLCEFKLGELVYINIISQKLVICTKSVEFMPFYLSFSTFLMSISFFLYGLLSDDAFIYVRVFSSHFFLKY